MRLQGELICLGSKSIGSFFSFKQKKKISVFLDFQSLHLCSSPIVIHLCQEIHIPWAFCSVTDILQCFTDIVTQLEAESAPKVSWAQSRGRWMEYPVTHRIAESEESSLEASFTPGTGNENCCKGFMKHKTKGPFRCVCGGINSSSEPPVFLFMSIFNIFDEFHNYWCLCSLDNNKTRDQC